MLLGEMQVKMKMKKDIIEILRDFQNRSLDNLFNDLIWDAQTLGEIILSNEMRLNTKKEFKDWPKYFRNVALEISLKGPIPIELIDLEKAVGRLLPLEQSYLSSFYMAHLLYSDDQKRDLVQIKLLCLKAVLRLLSSIVLGVDPSAPVEVKKLIEKGIKFDYVVEIAKDKKLQEEGVLPTPEDILRRFKEELN